MYMLLIYFLIGGIVLFTIYAKELKQVLETRKPTKLVFFIAIVMWLTIWPIDLAKDTYELIKKTLR